MNRRFSSTHKCAIDCRPSKGLGNAIAFCKAASLYGLLAFEGIYRFVGSKSANQGILRAIALWLNPNRLIQSGRCKCFLVPTIKPRVLTT
ncbi:hypothetical protein H6G35_24785 [Aulosira sp. FACHB-113]|nr:hypothetical protein [Aulosira sp. FACHB-113]